MWTRIVKGGHHGQPGTAIFRLLLVGFLHSELPTSLRCNSRLDAMPELATRVHDRAKGLASLPESARVAAGRLGRASISFRMFPHMPRHLSL